MLTAEQAVLWQKILNFQLNDPEAAFKFSERLARENGWNPNYALRVISEYKKFIFLCCISDNGVTPSDAVDQAWHLHLTFTRSYWIDLCRDTLGREIHHNPTKGGDSEAVKYDACYTDTNKLYTEVFQQYPPPDIWPENNARFSDIDFQRVNKRRNWVIRKPRANKIWPVLLIFTFGFGVIAMKSGDGGMFVLCFLAFFIVLLVVVFKRESWNKNDAGETSGCNTGGFGAYGDLDTGHHGHSGHGCHSGCNNHSGCGGHSGCSGCSSSGCSSGH
ncbi:glycine-rich domain-containing protein [Mucilaginibacter kameinonensis]|uniref:glycine-rich domain-containing protein n=1 Tax=Mucilaginibacter kameinonensis TaxID=452286 RepID=UPI001ABF183C|nr:hypothetical protein [Mucilaginibacter kameinonensis]